MKTPIEMLKKLKLIESRIAQKNKELDALYRRHKINSNGNWNMDNYGRVTYKHKYSNAQYLKNVKNAARISYNERNSNIARYIKASKKYRALLNLLPPKPQLNWPKVFHFIRKKKITQPLPSVRNIYRRYPSNRIGMSITNSGKNHNLNFSIHATKFTPNTYNQLENIAAKSSKRIQQELGFYMKR